MIKIPDFKDLTIKHIVCDFNGTLATDGILLPNISHLLSKIEKLYQLHVITSDTFGSVLEQLKKYDIKIKILTSDNHTKEKKDYIISLDANECIAIGNGNNDRLMLLRSGIGISIIGDEGCAKDALFASDIVCKNITDALSLCTNPKRLIATLRK